jgi:oligopeptide/dipeptide ABC transporter ATP-binding protein
MYAGWIVEEGDARTVFAEPAHPYTRALLRSVISLHTTELHYIPGAPPDLADPPRACRFHPRCPDAMFVCASKDPIEVRAETGQRVRCWLHGPGRRSLTAAMSRSRARRSPLPKRPEHPNGPLCVGAVIVDAEGRAFVHRRGPNRTLVPGCWDLPGGHVEPDEAPLDALRREIEEETGWHLRRVVAELGETT